MWVTGAAVDNHFPALALNLTSIAQLCDSPDTLTGRETRWKSTEEKMIQQELNFLEPKVLVLPMRRPGGCHGNTFVQLLLKDDASVKWKRTST